MMSILSKAGGTARFRATQFFAATTVSVVLGFLGMVGGQSVEPLIDLGGPEQPPPVSAPVGDDPAEPSPDVTVDEPVEIGPPESALGQAIWERFGEASFSAGPRARHDPSDIHPDSGSVQEPLRGDMVQFAWNNELKEGDSFALEAGGETYWLVVDVSNALKGGTFLQILLEEDEPEVNPDTGKADPDTFTGSTLLAALQVAGFTWKAPYPAEGDDIERGLRDWGVTLAGTSAAKVTLVVGGTEFVLNRLGETYFLG